MKYQQNETATNVTPPAATAKPPQIGREELTDLAEELRAVWHRLKRGIVLSPEYHGLQRQQQWVLGALAAGPRRMSDLAECAQISQASLTGIVDRLEEHGFVERTRSAEDRRVVEVALTNRGAEAARAAEAAHMERLQVVLEPLGPQERAEFRRLLRKLSQGSEH